MISFVVLYLFATKSSVFTKSPYAFELIESVQTPAATSHLDLHAINMWVQQKYLRASLADELLKQCRIFGKLMQVRQGSFIMTCIWTIPVQLCKMHLERKRAINMSWTMLRIEEFKVWSLASSSLDLTSNYCFEFFICVTLVFIARCKLWIEKLSVTNTLNLLFWESITENGMH